MLTESTQSELFLTTPSPGPLSLRAYARHRKTSVESVRRAIARGRLRASLVTVDGSPKIADPALADQEWARNTDLSKAPTTVKERAAGDPVASGTVTGDGVTRRDSDTPSSDAPTAPAALSAAAATEKGWKAKLAELDYRKKAGELVPLEDVVTYKAEVEARNLEKFTRVRTHILGVPTEAKHALPHLTHKDVLVFESLLRAALEQLADEKTPEHESAGGTAA